MSKRSFFFGIVLASLFGGLLALVGFKYFLDESRPYNSFEDKQNVRFTNFLADSSFTVPAGLNFVYAAEQVTPGVVHIKSTFGGGSGNQEGYSQNQPFEEFFKDFWGDQSPSQPREFRRGPSLGAGSGVIISEDGYIVTNNHVIDNADKIEVVLHDNRTYEGKLIGVDPTTDLALVKIEEKNLPFIKYGDSDRLKIGEWVLAVGNPFNLTSTVTAGIVSAKSRSIGILPDQNRMQIEAFIQTDAAVNPGNSGGALVNLKGELIGVNTAIATPTGSFAGYSFAVPVSLVKKVMNDLLEYGTVQRALLGVSISPVDANLAKEKDLKTLKGVYIQEVNPGSAAEDAGLKKGDVIIKLDDIQVNTVSELQEHVARNRPGAKVKVTFFRDGKEKTLPVTLKGVSEAKVVKTSNSAMIEGATFQDLKAEEKKKFKVDGGVKISKLEEGKWSEAGIREGFVITSVDKKKVNTVNDLINALNTKKGGILIEGVYPTGEQAYYGLGW